MKIIELILNEDEELAGIEAVSVVESPAIEEHFIALKKHEVELKTINEEKRLLMGAALIPKKQIYRRNEKTNEEYYIFFSKDTMRFFGQTLRSFKVKKQKDGRFKISAPSNSAPAYALYGDCETVRYFNPDNNELELK